MAKIQVGKVMLTPKGEYDSTKTYTRLDVVTYQGSSYVCLADTSTTPPGDSWQLLAGKGADGQPGKDGQPGSPGVTPHIDATTGNWFIGTTNTGVKAQGPAGQNGSDGKPGRNGSDGKPGADGVTPHIDSATGHWFIGSTDTGVSARGPQGEQGSPGKDGVTPDVSKLATKTDLANYYTKTETDTKLSTKADQAEYQTLNDKFNNMQIGGRNLVAGTAEPYVMSGGTVITTWKDGYAFEKLPLASVVSWEIMPRGSHTFFYNLTPGQEYTQTIWVETDATVKDLNAVQISWFTDGNGHDIQPARVQKLGQNSYKVVSTYTWPGKTDDNVRLFDTIELTNAFDLSTGTYLKFGKLKLEEGNVSTDWTPAPEDTITAIQKNATAIGQANKQITDLQTAVKAQQSAAIDTSSQSTNKKPSDYSDGIFYEVKYISALGIDRSELDVTAQAGTQVFLTTKAYNSYARQTAEVFDSKRPITFIRTGHNSTWNSWEVVTTW